MSAPTKGMVAGQPIQTGTVTPEYEEGFSRTFGERKAERGRWVYTAEGPVKVSEDWTDAEKRAETPTEGIVHGDCVATDGTVLDTKRKRREYMKQHGLADADDFKQHWQKKAKERQDFYSANSKEKRNKVTQAVVEAYRRLRKP